MTTFKGIRGTTIEVLSSDPSNPEIGQIWYNSSSGTLKGYQAIGVWTSGGNLGSAAYQAGQAGASNSSAILFNGAPASPGAQGTASTLYNGTSWTAGPSLPVNKFRPGGTGTQTAALSIGGNPQPASSPTAGAGSASFNGTSWTSITSLTTGRAWPGMSGTQTAALAFGGSIYTFPGSQSFQNITESWNGTSWTAGGTLPATKAQAMGAGTQTAALSAFGQSPGSSPSIVSTSNIYNGTSWTATSNGNTARNSLSGGGLQTAALAFGGQTPTATGATESFNGTAWTTNSASLAVARGGASYGNMGTQASTLMAGAGPANVSTESWNLYNIKKITAS
jgi:trimeric autotransporter adhesin